MSFYSNFLSMCNRIGKTPSKVVTEVGLKKSAVTRWKAGGNPTDATTQKIADYFGVPISELTDEKEKAPTQEGERDHAIDHIDDELKEYLDELRSRSEMRMLFSTTKNATKTQIEAIVKMIEEMQGEK